MTPIDSSESQRVLAKSPNQWLIARLAPMPTVLAKRCTNMSMKALASYFSRRDVGTYRASFADWLIE